MAETPPQDDPSPEDARQRILHAAAALIAEGGPDAATTRAIAAAAGVQAPTIYRLFGDKRGLLDAVAAQVLSAYIKDKTARPPHPDPVQDLREGWDIHVAFGLSHPAVFAILSSGASPQATAGEEVLARRIRAIARAGRLKVTEARAMALVQAMGTGAVQQQLALPPAARDPGLMAAAREAVVAAITTDAPAPAQGPAVAATMLQASLDQTGALTAGERHLLNELLTRIASA